MKIVNIIKKSFKAANKAYMGLGLLLVPVLTFATPSGPTLDAVAQAASTSGQDTKLAVFNWIFAIGALLFLIGLIVVLKKDVRNKFKVVATLWLLGAAAMAPATVIQLVDNTALTTSGNASTNMNTQFSG